MLLINDTETEAFYWITAPNMGDCGALNAQASVEHPGYDNKPLVTVKFGPNEGAAFQTVIPATGEGTAVTIGLFVL